MDVKSSTEKKYDIFSGYFEAQELKNMGITL